MGTFPSTRTTVTRSVTERTSINPTAPGVLSTKARTSSSLSTSLSESLCSVTNDCHCCADILFRCREVTNSPGDARCSTTTMFLPSAHFFCSVLKILLSWVEVMAVTLFCFETTTAMWWARQGDAVSRASTSKLGRKVLGFIYFSLLIRTYLVLLASKSIYQVAICK